MEIDMVRSAQWHPASTQPNAAPDRQAREAEMVQAVKAVNEAGLFGQQYELTFDQDRDSRRTLLRLVDKNTHEVVRQIPPEYLLRMARDLKGR